MATGGVETKYEIDVRNKDGVLYYHEATVPLELPEKPPDPTCFTVQCINEYMKKFSKWAEECEKIVEFHKALCEYHSLRCEYCMEHKNEKIDEKYITGEPSPQTIEEAKAEISKLRR